MDVVGRMTAADVPELARLHRAAFPSFFLSGLGERFLVQFYRGFLADPTAITVVIRGDHDRIGGAVVGTLEPDGFFGRLLRRQWPGFLAASVAAVLRSPSCAPRLLRAVRYRGGLAGEDGGALLSSICVDPAQQGHGLGRRLIDAWTAEATARGAQSAYLTTDAQDNEAVNAFYRARGWELKDQSVTPQGRRMHRYTRSLRAR